MSLDQISFKLGEMDSKLDGLLKSQNDIALNGCHMGREHSRQIAELQKRKNGGNGNPPRNWIEVTKDGIKSGGLTSVMVAILIFIAWNQYRNAGKADIDRDAIARVVQHEMRQLMTDKQEMKQ